MALDRGTAAAFARLDAMAWLRPDLARAAAWALLIALGTAPLSWLVLAEGGIRHTGVPLAADFTAFWTAARFAAGGQPLLAYDGPAMQAAQDALFPGRDFGYLGFFYPPSFLLALAPLGALPRVPAAVVFLLVSGLAYVLAVRPLLPRGATTAALLAFPAVVVVLDYGQNGLLSAALLGAGVVLLDRRPALAGIAFGLLAYKPQLGPLVPLLLALAGRWRCFGWAAATAIGMALFSTMLFGPEIWPAFLRNSAGARAQIEQGLIDYARMASLYGLLRGAGLPTAWSYVAQAVTAMLAAILVARVALRVADGRAQGAVLVAAIPFAAPYFYEYDAVILAVPMAWLLAEGVRAGFAPGERSILLLAFVAPLIAAIPALAANLVALLSAAALLAAVARRALAGQSAPARTGMPT